MGLQASKTIGMPVEEGIGAYWRRPRNAERRFRSKQDYGKSVIRRKTFLAMQSSYRGGKRLNLRLSEKQVLGAFKDFGGETAVRRAVSEAADDAADLSS